MTRAMDACADQETIVCATRVRERVTRDRTLLQEGAAPHHGRRGGSGVHFLCFRASHRSAGEAALIGAAGQYRAT